MPSMQAAGCPRAPSPQGPKPGAGPSAQNSGRTGASTNMFFLSEPSSAAGSCPEYQVFFSEDRESLAPDIERPDVDVLGKDSAVFYVGPMSGPSGTALSPKVIEFSCEPNELVPKAAVCREQYMSGSFLSYTFASAGDEPGGGALVDTAAQHGLIGEQTLMRHDELLQKRYRLRVQVTDEIVGTVRGVCGSEQLTKIATFLSGFQGDLVCYVYKLFWATCHAFDTCLSPFPARCSDRRACVPHCLHNDSCCADHVSQEHGACRDQHL